MTVSPPNPPDAASKRYTVGRYEILLPADHLLDRYQATWQRYDTALGGIAQAVFQKYPDSSAIDIGANVGDTAALIRSYADMPLLCIEGNPEFLQYLVENAVQLSAITIEDCFVGKDNQHIDFEQISSEGGTASVVNAVNPDSQWLIEMKSLETILQKHPQFQTSKLLKIDTDGFDFAIIQQSALTIAAQQPVLYFEYDITFAPTDASAALATIQTLFDIGYQKFILYDNFGNYLLSLPYPDYDRFVDLTACLVSNRFRSGTPAIYYFDICAFSERDSDLFEQIRQQELGG